MILGKPEASCQLKLDKTIIINIGCLRSFETPLWEVWHEMPRLGYQYGDDTAFLTKTDTIQILLLNISLLKLVKYKLWFDVNKWMFVNKKNRKLGA